MGEVAELLRGRREDLAASAAAMRRTAAETGETLSGQSREVRDTVDGLVARWRELGDTLVARAETLRDVGEAAVAHVDATMQSLDRHTGELSGTTDRMEHRVDGLRDALREQARDMHSSLDLTPVNNVRSNCSTLLTAICCHWNNKLLTSIYSIVKAAAQNSAASGICKAR